jgi:amino acid transporter
MGPIVKSYHLGRTKSFDAPFEGSSSNPGDIILGLYSSLYAYNGWDILNFGNEEIENPRRTLPIAAIVGLISALFTYLLINVAYFSVLTVEEFKETDTVAVLFTERTLGGFCYVVPFLIALLLLGNLNTTIFGCSRYVLSGSNSHYFPSFLRLLNLQSTSPRCSIVIEVFIAFGLTFIGSLEQILCYLTFAMWTQRFTVQIALMWMRYRRFPYPKDAFIVPIVLPAIFSVVCLALVVIPVVQDYHVAIYGAALIFSGILVYFLFIYNKRQPRFFSTIDGNL